ncbi:23S rRNA (pseudouridine(1915)-N(3))-methyltransferase RlmH [Rhizobium sp. SG2393]|uniref:23S rRNA (pseudouridine(1915)-N(3))-methyltransferase RlmH n=1 Tax=Rhizobium sp. SG2393 TaxID=3276279 RepID=UPI00366B654E
MRVSLFAVGRLKSGPEKDLASRYIDRFAKAGPAVGLEFGRMVEINESRAGNPETRKRDEAAELEKILTDQTQLVLLDERGKMIGSEDFAARIGSWRDNGRRDVVFAIGGADGLLPALHDRAAEVLCFGRMTWPHQIARILLAEQLYRATTILSGHPYHRV